MTETSNAGILRYADLGRRWGTLHNDSICEECSHPLRDHRTPGTECIRVMGVSRCGCGMFNHIDLPRFIRRDATRLEMIEEQERRAGG